MTEHLWVWPLVVSGFGLFGGLLARFVARKLADDVVNTDDTEESIRRHGEKQRQMILEEAKRACEEKYEDARHSLQEELEVERKLYEKLETEINERHQELDRSLQSCQNQTKDLQQKLSMVRTAHDRARELFRSEEEVFREMSRRLSERLGHPIDEVLQAEREGFLSATRLETSKALMESGEAMKKDAQRFAAHVLADVDARYKPRFVWPKVSYSVALTDPDIAERYFSDEAGILPLLTADTMTSLELMRSEGLPTALKISGGAGLDKEAIRLTLEEMIGKKQFQMEHVRGIYARNKKKVDKLAARMGQEAVKKLEIGHVHPEIEKLIGSLNYRTSHRQNQYYHSLEVATLAGMLADEVGVDRVLAKRSGLLHDIGKALDYRIEGSHAVISGDYAEKYGEDVEVVDTVLSHHDDKIVETPHAYILKAADAMSGARPGARVDMEEGYQKRIDDINQVISSFQPAGVTSSAVMHAGREVHVFVDNRKVKERDIDPLAADIARKLESDVQFPGQIRVTVVRRLEISAVA